MKGKIILIDDDHDPVGNFVEAMQNRGIEVNNAQHEELQRLQKLAWAKRNITVPFNKLAAIHDALQREHGLERSQENLALFREAGLLVGLGSHNHEVIAEIENQGWDLDFYQCSFYRSVFGYKTARGKGEWFEAADREAMARVIRQVSKPCLAFKVLGAGRHCQSRQTTETALRFAYEHIKPNDVVLVGMWQKYQDQAADNVALVRHILQKT